MDVISKQFMEEYDRGLKQNALVPMDGKISQLDRTVVKQVKVGSVSYSPENGVVTLPEGGGGEASDKNYDPEHFSGLGRKTLKLKDDGSNVLVQGDFDQANTIYIIAYDFDLNDPNGENPINIPSNCVLEFDGGSVGNGRLVSNDTVLCGTFNSSNDSLFGVFYDVNKNALGWDKNVIRDWKSMTEFGNFITSIEPGEYFGLNQSVVIDGNYVYLLFSEDYTENDTALAHVTVVVYDRNFNYLGYSLLDRSSHANGATIYNNKIYIACSSRFQDNDTIHVVDIPTLVANCAYNKGKLRNSSRITSVSPIRLGYTIHSIDYDPVTDKFVLGRVSPSYVICDTSFNVIKRSQINDYRQFFINKYGRETIIQDFVYQNGVLFIFDWNRSYNDDNYSSSAVVYTIDVATDKVINAQPVNLGVLLSENEGVCKDVVTGRIYISCNCHGYYGITSAFSVSAIEYNAVDEGSKSRQIVNEEHWINDGQSMAVFIDNNYTGPSCGSQSYPYKTLGEAIMMAGGTNRIEFGLAYSSMPYYVSALRVSDVKARFYGSSVGSNGEYPIIDGYLLFRDSDVNIDRIHFRPTARTVGITAFDAILKLEQHCNAHVERTKFSNESGSSAIRNIILINHSFIFIKGVEFSDTRTGSAMSHILMYGVCNKAAVVSATVSDGNLVNPGDLVYDTNCFNEMVVHDLDNITFGRNALLASNPTRQPSLIRLAKPVSSMEQLNKVRSVFKSTDGSREVQSFGLSFFMSLSLTETGKGVYRPGWYTNDVGGIRSLEDTVVHDGIYMCLKNELPANGSVPGRMIFESSTGIPLWWNGSRWINALGGNLSGSTRPTVTEIGTQFFDTTLGKPVYWDGNYWVDSTGARV